MVRVFIITITEKTGGTGRQPSRVPHMLTGNGTTEQTLQGLSEQLYACQHGLTTIFRTLQQQHDTQRVADMV